MYKALLLILIAICFNTASAEEIIKAKNSSHCVVTKALTINELIDNSGIIFKGKLKSINYKDNNRKLKFRVSDPLRGVDAKAKEITITEWASLKTPFNEEFDKSKTYVFFFYKPSNRGLSSLAGMEQGLVEVQRKGKLKYSSKLKLKNTKAKLATSSATGTDLTNYDNLKQFIVK